MQLTKGSGRVAPANGYHMYILSAPTSSDYPAVMRFGNALTAAGLCATVATIGLAMLLAEVLKPLAWILMIGGGVVGLLTGISPLWGRFRLRFWVSPRPQSRCQNESLNILDLSNPYGIITDRTFRDCQIFGPAVMRYERVTTEGIQLHDVPEECTVWKLPGDRTNRSVIINVNDCEFINCHMWGIRMEEA